MKKILVCPDIHFCQNWSIVRERGEKFSLRLENCIKSINWVKDTALKNNCSSIFYLGDFFDKSSLNAEEITALSEINFDIDCHQFIIVGNHETTVANNLFNSSNSLKNVVVFNNYFCLEDDNIAIHLLPYIYDCPTDLKQIIQTVRNKKNIVLSHNDLKDVNYGSFISKEGFDLESITNNCDLFINGHIHNNSWINNKILNLGILTGKDFKEDCSKYVHQVAIIDLETLKVELIENPYAFNFTRLQVNNVEDLDNQLQNLNKNNLVLYVKCSSEIYNEIKTKLEYYRLNTEKVAVYQLVTMNTLKVLNTFNESVDKDLNKIDPLKDLRSFIISSLPDDKYVLEELNKICT